MLTFLSSNNKIMKTVALTSAQFSDFQPKSDSKPFWERIFLFRYSNKCVPGLPVPSRMREEKIDGSNVIRNDL